MTTTTKTTRHYYAAAYPRGFANEADILCFTSREARDTFVSDYKGERAEAITRADARAMLTTKDDACTQYNYRGVGCYVGGSDDRYNQNECMHYIDDYTQGGHEPLAGLVASPVAL